MGDFREFRMSTDELTGLLDKQTFLECAQNLINTAPANQEYAFIFFDLENFKIFNANYGYEIGDELLTSIAYILKEEFEGQLISHFSGDHFVACVNTIQVIQSIKSIRDRIKLIRKSVSVELKAGIYLYDGEEKDVIKCCDRARMACISIKKKYDVGYRVYDKELGGSIQRKQSILDRLDEAIAKRYIKVYYQPIVRSFTGEVCAWEALVRWQDPIRGVVYPNEFIPVLEEYRLIQKIDMFVIDEVFGRYHREVEGRMPAVPVSINLSRIDFEVMDLVEFLETKIRQYKCPKNMFHLEITESALMDNTEHIMTQIEKLRQNGFEVWMDDFGSGFSSLNLLKNYQFDLVKIDMDFLSEFEESENDKIILKHIVSMIKNLGSHTLIEGVETKAQFDFMKSIGCEMIQGYLIGRPMPYLEGLDSMKKSGRTLETYDERIFNDEIGKIDILRQNPLQNVAHPDDDSALPLAVLVVENEVWSLKYTNQEFMETMLIFGYKDEEDIELMLNKDHKRWLQYHHFIDICAHSKKEQISESMDYISNGRIVNMRVRHMGESKEGKRDAYMVSCRLLSRFINSNYDNRITEISRSMFSLYESVDLFGIHDDFYENIYLNDSRLYTEFDEGKRKSKEVIEGICEKLVHEDDRVYFRQMFDMDTIEQRIAEEPNGATIGFFRIMDSRYNYVWKTVTLSIMHFENNDCVLCCVNEAPNEIARRMANSQQERRNLDEDSRIDAINMNPTFENILQLIPVGVFWKDRERKFLGANQMFLDYYGLQSVQEIIGKTDEDMGWHINPDAFKKDELEVINNGRTIENVRGECIVRGSVRKIAASKQPYVVDRKIVGLVGYFKDVTDELKEQEKLELLTMTDALTGLYNRRAFAEIVDKFMSQYVSDRTDFALLMIDIDKFKQINDLYGHDYGDIVLTKISRILKHVASDNSVVFRFGGDEFVILHQQKNEAELESIKLEILAELNRANQMASVSITIQLSIGVAIYSEYGNLRDCLEAADKEMYVEKEQHKKEQ
ncbi:EAL domain-containing protein [Pseudobutyrivibrio xylanivorans]|uniref:Diguanylate cyclase (GGDEF) domain-containing protein n=1 Tax=Pseudobutyrivibrio xylanivorans DSM 14809 TaxID=1123012 RepID=A0A1M6DBE6_PSEXY|nr:EAL domain-containing protein [Pseudobutyrivibrio xylanivorans]SHI70543.1 diguanylate cyclase (GGDEF) domain-containing protein [Pseudobutyrivibrio xylanivorans DSM 14809]